MKTVKRGYVLLVVLVIGLVIAILGSAILRMGLGGRSVSAISSDSIIARIAADAGITRAIYEMNAHFTIADGWDGYLPQVTDLSLDNTNATCSYTVQEMDDYWLVKSTGKMDNQARTVYAIVGLRNLFDYGLIVTDTIKLLNKNLIDGYDSALGPYSEANSRKHVKIGTTSIADGAIWLGQLTEITGDVLAGIGGNVNRVITNPSGGAITGSRYTMPEPFKFNSIPVPDCGLSCGSLNEPNYTIGKVGEIAYRKYDNIIIPNSGILNILGEVHLHVTGDIILHNDAELRVKGVPMEPSSWSSATIYLDGDLTVNQEGIINNATEKPQNFKLFGIGTSEQGENWNINNSGFYYGIYYGPNAIIHTFNGAQFYGSVSGREFVMNLDVGLHYDHDLSNMTDYDVGFGIDRWWEKSDFIAAE